MHTEYDYYLKTDCKEENNGDAKAIISVDAYLMENDELVSDGRTIAFVILSSHNDLIVVWCGNEGRENPDVLKLIEKAKIEIEEYQ